MFVKESRANVSKCHSGPKGSEC